MQRDGQHQQHRPVPAGLDALGLFSGKTQVQMRQDLVDDPQKSPTGQEPDDRRHPRLTTLRFDHFDGRRQQGPETGGDHDTRRESQHGIEQLAVDLLEEKYEGRPQGGHAPGEQRRQQSLFYRMQFYKPRQAMDSPVFEKSANRFGDLYSTTVCKVDQTSKWPLICGQRP